MSQQPIVISLSPNAQTDDLRLARSLIKHPRQYQSGPALKQLNRALQQYFPDGETYLTNSGRSALYLAIRSLKLNSSDEVLMQAYTCNAVPNPVLWAGATPRYVDINKETLNMSVEHLKAQITQHSKVIIVQHTFGYPAEMEAIMDLARKHKLIVIEDCAHALGARIQNTLVGNFGDMAIFSFGRDKIISSVYGGFLLANNPHLVKAVESEYSQLTLPARWWTLQQLVHPLVFSVGLRFYTVAGLGKALLEIMKRLHFISRAVTDGEKYAKKPKYFPARLPNALAALALQQLNKLPDFQAHRTALVRYYDTHLKNPIVKSVQTMTQNTAVVEPAYLRYTVLVEHPIKLIQYAKQQGIMLGDWYNAAITPPGTSEQAVGYVPGSCPAAEEVAKHTVNLPTHINISTHDAERIVKVINSFV